MRRKLREIIEADPELTLAGLARDGEDVLLKARELRPDVVSMDINMPKLDGISALQILVEEDICPVVMVSSLTQKDAVITFTALELGAFDYVAKPDGTVSDMKTVARELCAKLKAAGAGGGTLSRLRRRRGIRVQPTGADRESKHEQPTRTTATLKSAPKAIAIGISTGGPSTLMEVLPQLPADLNAIVFVVQHMPGTFTGPFARRLDEACQLHVVEASAGAEVKVGHCYVARGDFQMTVQRVASGQLLLRTPHGPQTTFRPSVNVMMESVLDVFGRNTIGVLMTGIGDDGADMMVRIKAAGGHTIAESKESAIVFGMPRVAIERNGAVEILPSNEIAAALVRKLQRSS
jgi:two-component system chemotaxis response regulator CheB